MKIYSYIYVHNLLKNKEAPLLLEATDKPTPQSFSKSRSLVDSCIGHAIDRDDSPEILPALEELKSVLAP